MKQINQDKKSPMKTESLIIIVLVFVNVLLVFQLVFENKPQNQEQIISNFSSINFSNATIPELTIAEKLTIIAQNISSSHEYIRNVYDCTQFSRDLVRELKNQNITSYCVGSYMKNWTDENKTQWKQKLLHTWVEAQVNGTIYPIEATRGYIIDENIYKRDYVITERGVCW